MTQQTRPINPFSTSRIRPGAIAFRFTNPEDNEDRLIERFLAERRMGQIVGPHGSGKSTLLAALRDRFQQRGREIVHVELHDGCRRLSIGREEWRSIKRNADRSLLLIDGFEQLGRLTRWSVAAAARRRRFGLLITAHDESSSSLPTLYRTEVDRELARRLVDELTADYPFSIEPDELDELMSRHKGDFRNVLFSLYDRFEEDRREKND